LVVLDTAPGSEADKPSIEVQPPLPAQWYIAPSLPRTNPPKRPEPQDATSGEDVPDPPSDTQEDQAEPVHDFCHIVPSVPRANTSILLGPHETQDGSPDSKPPR
jgi:hypothetical protein